MSKQTSPTLLTTLAVAAYAAAISLSATAETRFWADSNGDTASFNAVDSWDPAPADMADVAEDTLALNKGFDKIATVGNGDNVSVKTLYVGWGTTNGTNMATSLDKGGRLDVSGGSLTVTDTFRLGGGYSDNSNNVVNVTGGEVHAAKLYTSDCNSNGGAKNETLNISGGLFETTGETRLATYGWGITLVNITNGGTFRAGNTVSIGRSGKSVVNVTGANFDMNGKNLYVGHSGDRAVGELTLDNVLSDVNIDQFRVGNEGGSSGSVVVSGDSTSVKVTYAIYVGKQGNGEFTINGGLVSSAYAVQLGDDNINGNNSVLNLNGGVLKTAQVNVHGTPNAIINWNGGTLQRGNNTFVSNGEMCPASDNLDIRVLAGGAIYDGGDTFSQPLHGAGALVKRGSATATFAGALDLKGGFKVEGGTLNVSNLVRTRFKEISVGDGCHLNLNGASVEVVSYKVAGDPKPTGTYSEQGGTITVLSVDDTTPASAIWTNAGGDNDVANPDNWDVLNSKGEELLDDVVPAADLPITVVYVPNLPSFAGFTDVTCIVDSDIRSEGYSRHGVVLEKAAVWYDPSDDGKTQVENGKVTVLGNKGAMGADFDLLPYETSPADIGTDGFNGRKSVHFTGNQGYRSEGMYPSALPPNASRTLFAVGNGGDMYLISASQNDSAEEGRVLLLTGSWGNAMQTCQYKTDGEKWDSAKVSYSRTANNPYVFMGRTELGAEETATVTAVSLSENGTESRNTGSFYIPDQGHSLELRSYYGVFRVNSGFSLRSNGYQGEALIFTNALSDAEMSAVGAYLKEKWLDPLVVMPDFDSLAVNAQVDLGGATRTFERLSGSGSFVDGTVVLNGDLIVTVNPDQSVVAPSFDKLVLGENARLVVKGARYLPTKGAIPVVEFSSIQDEFAAVVGDGGAKPKVAYTDSTIEARRDSGMRVMLR